MWHDLVTTSRAAVKICQIRANNFIEQVCPPGEKKIGAKMHARCRGRSNEKKHGNVEQKIKHICSEWLGLSCRTIITLQHVFRMRDISFGISL